MVEEEFIGLEGKWPVIGLEGKWPVIGLEGKWQVTVFWDKT